MDVRLQIAVASEGVNVSALCRTLAMSRPTYYLWRGRYLEHGLAGLEPLSRAPHSSPQRVDPEIEAAIVELRKKLTEDGFDAGPGTIQWHLGRQGLKAIPSQSTIWRVLTRRGFVVPQPKKRPKSSWQRFVASAPNELWQADVIDWAIAAGPVKIMSFIDDHSRTALRVKALMAATSEATWDTFCEATERWGVPVGQLNDNGLNFSGKLRSVEVHFERNLRAIGVVAKTSRPYHPQTCGKVERFQQTLKRWLRKQPLAADLDELQAQLDVFVDYYNHQRPHRAHPRHMTPAEAWALTPPAINLGIALPGPAHDHTVVICPKGVARTRCYNIHVGAKWAGQTASVRHDDTHAAVFVDHKLVRALALDTTRHYQPSTTKRPPADTIG